MGIHGLIRTTEDIDFLIEDSLENQARVKQALLVLPDKVIKELGDENISDFIVVRVNDEICVDLMTNACGINYSEAVVIGVNNDTTYGVLIPVASKNLMIALKC